MEFSQYLLDEAAFAGPEMLNGHFRPQWALCPFCLIDFNILGKIEDFEEDSAYIMDALRVRVSYKFDVNHGLFHINQKL